MNKNVYRRFTLSARPRIFERLRALRKTKPPNVTGRFCFRFTLGAKGSVYHRKSNVPIALDAWTSSECTLPHAPNHTQLLFYIRTIKSQGKKETGDLRYKIYE